MKTKKCFKCNGSGMNITKTKFRQMLTDIEKTEKQKIIDERFKNKHIKFTPILSLLDCFRVIMAMEKFHHNLLHNKKTQCSMCKGNGIIIYPYN